jgi:hypothetical protein
MIVETTKKSMIEEIRERLSDPDGIVQITTYYKSWIYDHHHVDFFKEDATGAPMVRQGKRFVCFRGASVRLGRYAKI